MPKYLQAERNQNGGGKVIAKKFLSGNEAFAYGVRLARPQVISAYPITPQTIVVEKLSEFVEDGSLNAEFVHVESEHSALSCAMGASSVGARAFTATSSQGFLYMAEVTAALKARIGVKPARVVVHPDGGPDTRSEHKSRRVIDERTLEYHI